MKRPLLFILPLLALLAASTPVCAQPAAAPGTGPKSGSDRFLEVRRSIERDLTAANEDIAELRRVIEREKVPLHEQLSTQEETLATRRREFDEARRQADLRALETSNINTEGRLRAEENLYLANLLDEYTRGFETRLHPSEQGRFKELVSAVKLAPENSNLSDAEKFQQRMRLLDLSIDRLGDLVGGARFEGEVLDSDGVVAKGRIVLVGPLGVFANETGSLAGVVAPQGDGGMPVLRKLDETMTPGIANIVNHLEGILPFDASRGGALQEFLHKTSLIEMFLHGGPIMWPILLCSIIGVAMSLDRVFFVIREKGRRQPKTVAAMFEAVEQGLLDKAVEIGRGSKDFVAQMLSYAISHRGINFHTAISKSSQTQVKRFTRGLWVLDTVITMAPLLGLLGTVAGMMGSFQVLGSAGESSGGTNAIVAGIAEALIATAFGLVIAIAALVPLNFLNEQIEAVTHELEDAGSHLELLLRGDHKQPVGTPPPSGGSDASAAAPAPAAAPEGASPRGYIRIPLGGQPA